MLLGRKCSVCGERFKSQFSKTTCDKCTSAQSEAASRHGRYLYSCRSCGHYPGSSERPAFCPQCGERFVCPGRCPKCGQALQEVGQFCPVCGTRGIT